MPRLRRCILFYRKVTAGTACLPAAAQQARSFPAPACSLVSLPVAGWHFHSLSHRNGTRDTACASQAVHAGTAAASSRWATISMRESGGRTGSTAQAAARQSLGTGTPVSKQVTGGMEGAGHAFQSCANKAGASARSLRSQRRASPCVCALQCGWRPAQPPSRDGQARCIPISSPMHAGPAPAAGEFAEGKRNGKGRCIYSDGSKYEGGGQAAGGGGLPQAAGVGRAGQPVWPGQPVWHWADGLAPARCGRLCLPAAWCDCHAMPRLPACLQASGRTTSGTARAPASLQAATSTRVRASPPAARLP